MHGELITLTYSLLIKTTELSDFDKDLTKIRYAEPVKVEPVSTLPQRDYSS
jgi:hypothetical protein